MRALEGGSGSRRHGRPARRPPRWLGALLAAGIGVSCSATNYLDPRGPLYAGRLAVETPAPVPGAPLRVVTFNIAYAREIDRALQVLRENPPLVRPDVLCLQEMDAPGVERMARELEMNWVYYPSAVHPKTHRDFGCAILSPWPLVEAGKVVLPIAATGSGIRRSAARATIVRGLERVRVYSVHLPSPLGVGEEARRKQAAVLLDDAARSPDPVVIAGDLNSRGLGKVFEKRGYAWITRDNGATTRFWCFGLRFDHIFARGLSAETGVVASGVVEDNRDASDHRPVWAVLVSSRAKAERTPDAP
jgi:endonuclease/exonuclease/phosphatase family metal-dependent hydrolase